MAFLPLNGPAMCSSSPPSMGYGKGGVHEFSKRCTLGKSLVDGETRWVRRMAPLEFTNSFLSRNLPTLNPTANGVKVATSGGTSRRSTTKNATARCHGRSLMVISVLTPSKGEVVIK